MSNPPATSRSTNPWRVLKFGGTSVRDAARMRNVAELVKRAQSRSPRVAVVVSALGGVTDQLQRLADEQAREPILAEINQRHQEAASQLADPVAIRAVEALLAELADLASALPVGEGKVSLEQSDLLLSFGERLSAPLVAAAVRESGLAASACDMRSLVATSNKFSQASVDQDATLPALHQHFNEAENTLVATGFVGSTTDGRTTTLGRGGSDLTAALLGAALDAAEIEIWTDVDGVLSADPRVVPHASSIPYLSYEEVMELAHFGAKVLFPPTVAPARERKIPIRILNTLAPDFEGTLVGTAEGDQPFSEPSPDRPFTGITSIADVALLTLRGSGLLGATGTAHRFFRALANADCNAILISQASSEQSICAAVSPERAEQARAEVDREFAAERAKRRVRATSIEAPVSVVAVVGEGMRERPGVAAQVFCVLGDNGINVRAIAQGSSELNISMAVKQSDREAAVRALHDGLFGACASSRKPLDVVVAGVGGVGAEVLAMIEDSDRLRLVGVLASQHQWLATEGDRLDLGTVNAPFTSPEWRQLLATKAPNDSAALTAWLTSHFERSAHGCAFVDCTANEPLTAIYPELAEAGAHIVAANKVGFTRDATDPAGLPWFGEAGSSDARLGYEATVGAGLPVISTLRTLIEGGDTVTEISGVFSGTLGYLLAQLRAGAKPSRAIKAAFEAGYTEPDPRDDLSGTDVARKLLILARTCGAQVNLEDIAVEPLVPFDPTADIEAFWNELPASDAQLEQLLAEAQAEGTTLAYLARLGFDGGHVACKSPSLSVGLTALPPEHPACQLQGTDNLFRFTTQRYSEQPLTIRGPGAGTGVTAAGVLGDLLALHSTQA